MRSKLSNTENQLKLLRKNKVNDNKTTKSKRKILVSKLDKICSEYVRARDGKCFCCGTPLKATNGHLITRAKYSVRWDLINCNQQCSPCNFKHEYYPEVYTQKFIKKYGMEVYDDLIYRSNQVANFTIEQLEKIYEGLKRKLKELTNEG